MLIIGESPVFDGAPINQRESLRSIYQFVISNILTDSGTENLLDLIQSHCPKPNLIPQTVHKLKKNKFINQTVQNCSIAVNVWV